MELQLKNKKAFVTGSTSGIGFATAKLLVQEGAEVIINGRTNENIDKAIKLILADFPNATITGEVADFRNQNSVNELIDSLEDIDILINNVGIYKSQSFEDTTDEDWMEMMEVNLMSGVRLSRALLPKMLQRNWGRILFVSSECASLVPVDLIAYSTTKAAMLSLSRGLAQMSRGTNVTVNTILPGSTLSEGAEQFLKQQSEIHQQSIKEVTNNFFKNVRTSSLIERFISTEEISNMLVYLSSPLSGATNGAALKVDGGSISGIL